MLDRQSALLDHLQKQSWGLGVLRIGLFASVNFLGCSFVTKGGREVSKQWPLGNPVSVHNG